jgi:DNA replication ATP-dependent helicase Dna2
MMIQEILPAKISFCAKREQFRIKGTTLPKECSGTLLNPGKEFALQMMLVLDILHPPDLEIPIHLVNPVWNTNGDCQPMSIVLLPDWLIDVTRICHDLAAPENIEINSLLHRYSTPEKSVILLSGNICHHITASLISQPEQTLDEIHTTCFQQFGLQLSTLNDSTLHDLLNRIGEQYRNIKHCIHEQFPALQIHSKDLIIEPTYFCPSIGIQGRPDFLHQGQKDGLADILEIKSGKPPANLSLPTHPVHQIQTTLYQTMVSQNHMLQSTGKNMTLYAGAKEHALRVSPDSIDALLKAIQVRNSIVLQDIRMTTPNGHKHNLDQLLSNVSPPYPSFLETKRENIKAIYHRLSPLEQAYWHFYGAAIHKEHQFSRLGTDLNPGGQSMLWTATDEEKVSARRLEKKLRIETFSQTSHTLTLTLCKEIENNDHTTFRKGDIVILYPDQKTCFSYCNLPPHPVTRCTVTESSKTHLTIKLKTYQHNLDFFTLWKYWCLESDTLDSSFQQLYHGLAECMAAPQGYRQMFLGISVPQMKESQPVLTAHNPLTAHQEKIIRTALQAKDYYLIWGPPGTGKTSMIISELVYQLMHNETAPLMLLAYTNRAVDELCQAVLAVDSGFADLLVRIGSANTASDSSNVLILDVMLKSCKSRKEITALLRHKRIFAATISSIYHKPELFQLVHFHTVIIDEASQVTEPMVAGLLSRFKKWILVGDHLQLPAVSLQRENETVISDDRLQNAGFYSTQTSCFERLLHQATKKSWDHVIGMLYEQGRLHHSLLSFPNSCFYHSRLTIPECCHKLQDDTYFFELPDILTKMGNRKLLIDCDSGSTGSPNKSCLQETDLVIKCLKLLLLIYHYNHRQPGPQSIGIISPFRSQATHINHHIQHQLPSFSNLVTADTIERYQGATRDVIIISFGVQHASLLENIQSISSQGIDRKLNVALTRAREQIILIGNTRLLKMKSPYPMLFAEYTTLSISEIEKMYEMTLDYHGIKPQFLNTL